jgi:hypothetical protein
MAPAHEGYRMTAPLAHAAGREYSHGPEDKALQPVCAVGDAVLGAVGMLLIYSVCLLLCSK